MTNAGEQPRSRARRARDDGRQLCFGGRRRLVRRIGRRHAASRRTDCGVGASGCSTTGDALGVLPGALISRASRSIASCSSRHRSGSAPPDPSRGSAARARRRRAGCPASRARRRRRLAQVRRDDLADALDIERRPAGEHVEQHAAERVDVGALIDAGPRRGTARATCTPACRASRRSASHPAGLVVADSFAMPKSRIFVRSPPCASRIADEEHVVGLEIAMDDAARVRRRERAARPGA